MITPARPLTVVLLQARYAGNLMPGAGGVSTVTNELTRGLCDLGHRVRVIRASVDKKDSHNRKASRDEGDHNIRIWDCPQQDVPDWDGQKVPAGTLIKFILKDWTDIRGDVLHAHDWHSLVAARAVGAAHNVPVVFTHHSAPTEFFENIAWEEPKEAFLRMMLRVRLVDSIVVPSKASEDQLIKRGFAKQDITVIPWGMSAKFHQSRANDLALKQQLANLKPLVFCPTRIDPPHKDVDFFVTAAIDVLQRWQGTRQPTFLIATDPNVPAGVELRRRIAAMNLTNHFMLRTFSRSEMPTVYRSADVTVVPSRRESFGMVVLEAFIFKSPVIAAARAAIPEVVKHRVTGFLFTDGAVDQLADRICDLLRQPKKAALVTEFALRAVKTDFTRERMALDHSRLYQRLISS